MSEHDPYAPPAVDVFDVPAQAPGDERLAVEPLGLPAGAGWQWYVRAWRIFRLQPFLWWLVMLIAIGGFFVVSLVPVLNLAIYLLFPVLLAGFASCARSAERDGGFEIGQIFDGFRRETGALMLLGVIYLGATLVMMVGLAMSIGGIGMLGALLGLEPSAGGGPVTVGASIIGVALATAVGVLAALMMTFSSLMVFEFKAPIGAALKHSLTGSIRNVLPMVVSLLVYLVLMVVATIPLGLGWLVLLPMISVLPWVTYREIFVERAGAA